MKCKEILLRHPNTETGLNQQKVRASAYIPTRYIDSRITAEVTRLVSFLTNRNEEEKERYSLNWEQAHVIKQIHLGPKCVTCLNFKILTPPRKQTLLGDLKLHRHLSTRSVR